MPSFRFRQLTLLAVDLLLLYAALAAALLVRYQQIDAANWDLHWRPFTLVFFLWLIIFYLAGMYELRIAKNDLIFFKALFGAVGIAALVATGFFYLIPFFEIAPKTNLLLTVVIFTALFVAWRTVWNKKIGPTILKTRVLFVGDSPEVRDLVRAFSHDPQVGYETIGVAEPHEVDMTQIERKGVHMIVLAGDASRNPELAKKLYQALLTRVAITDIVSFFELITHRVPTAALSEMWFLENIRESRKIFYDLFRAVASIILALLILCALFLMTPFIALAILLEDRGPTFYRQTRIGRFGKPFTVVKFRTMRTDAEAEGPQFAGDNDPRVTRMGRILRKLRIDELPQAWNILKGEMSFIGPRPERPEFVEELTRAMPFYPIRHLVRPGMTGWAQVNYPYAATLKENLVKLQYDIFYVKNRSLLVDFAILLKTINEILRGRGR